ncbi:MAG: hypothetical protein RML38_11110, partial [Bacteroidia bacterium]|nr:hypothetical protein [Bacteroidia bacterium]
RFAPHWANAHPPHASRKKNLINTSQKTYFLFAFKPFNQSASNVQNSNNFVRQMRIIYLNFILIVLLFEQACFHGITYYYRPQHDTIKTTYKYQKIAQLDCSIKESSGIVVVKDSLLLTHSDSGNPPYLYLTNLKGKLIKKFYVKNVHAIDWEAITLGEDKIYLADIGNNSFQRQQLSIYTIPLSWDKDTLEPIQKIVYVYPDQKHYPKHRHHDAEAIFYAKPYLYIFTKNYGTKSTDVYRVNPEIDYVQAATWLARSYLDSYVTDVAYSPAKNEIALLTYGFVYIYRTQLDSGLFKNARLTMRLRIPISQTEAITYLNDNTLLITNEKGKIFKLTLFYTRRQSFLDDCCVGCGLF